MANILDVSAITDQIKARISQLEEQLKQHQKLSDELERLRGALVRLEGEVRSRVNVGRRGRGPTSAAKSAAVPKAAAKPKSVGARAPRGQNKAKVLKALQHGPMTASEISKQTGIATATASTLLSKMAKSGELAKAERGYSLPK